MTLFANTIEFNGCKAVINSYSDHPALKKSMNEQRESWMAQYPNATVKTEEMSEIEVMKLVAEGNAKALASHGRGYGYCHIVGKSSEG